MWFANGYGYFRDHQSLEVISPIRTVCCTCETCAHSYSVIGFHYLLVGKYEIIFLNSSEMSYLQTGDAFITVNTIDVFTINICSFAVIICNVRCDCLNVYLVLRFLFALDCTFPFYGISLLYGASNKTIKVSMVLWKVGGGGGWRASVERKRIGLFFLTIIFLPYSSTAFHFGISEKVVLQIVISL